MHNVNGDGSIKNSKNIEKWYYPQSRRLTVNVVSPFYDICGFDLLPFPMHFLYLYCAVLLSDLSTLLFYNSKNRTGWGLGRLTISRVILSYFNCACANVTEMAVFPFPVRIWYYHLSQWRRFYVIGLKCWQFCNITYNFGHISTALAQKRLFVSFRSEFWHNHSIRRPRFPNRERFHRWGIFFCYAIFCMSRSGGISISGLKSAASIFREWIVIVWKVRNVHCICLQT